MSNPSPSFARIKEIFTEAAALVGDERRVYLDRACAGDTALRAEVESLLDASDRTTGFVGTVGPATDSSELRGPIAEHVGSRVGRFELLEKLGEGGFGVVFAARQTEPIVRTVALKIIKPGMDSGEVIARFDTERQALALMDHPNIARVYDAGATEAGRPYFVMELVDGPSITAYCDAARLTIEQRLDLFGQVCRAVAHAHQKGLIHRDIKPSNVLITVQDGRPIAKVIDFGIVKAIAGSSVSRNHTSIQQLVGTPAYMSPEQAEGNPDIDTRSDIYGLGVLLYELLSGMLPFDPAELRDRAFGEMQRIIREVEATPPATRLSSSARLAQVAAQRSTQPRQLTARLRGDLEWIVLRCLEKDRSRRYSSVVELDADLGRYLRGDAVSAAAPSRVYRFKKFARRHRWSLGTSLGIAAALVIGLIIAMFAWRDARRQRDEAIHERARAEVALRDAEAARADTEAVNEFLTKDLLGSADPSVTQGRELGLVDVVNNAAKSVGTKLSGRPLIEATVRSTLALTYHTLGRVEPGIEQARIAVRLREQSLGADHPLTLDAKHRLAQLLQDTKGLAESEAIYRDVIDKGARVLGPDDPNLLDWTSDYIRLLDDSGRVKEALPLARKNLAAIRRVLGEDEPRTLVATSVLAALARQAGATAEAESLYRELLAKRERLLGPLHPETINSLNDTAVLYAQLERYPEAEKLLREAADRYQKVCGEDHPNTIVGKMNLAGLLTLEGRAAEAVPVLRDCLARSTRLFGADDNYTITATTRLALALSKTGELAEADVLSKDALDRASRILGADHPTTLRAKSVRQKVEEALGLRPATTTPATTASTRP